MTGAGETWPGMVAAGTRLWQQVGQVRQNQIPPIGGELAEDQPQAQELDAGQDVQALRHLHREENQSG